MVDKQLKTLIRFLEECLERDREKYSVPRENGGLKFIKSCDFGNKTKAYFRVRFGGLM